MQSLPHTQGRRAKKRTSEGPGDGLHAQNHRSLHRVCHARIMPMPISDTVPRHATQLTPDESNQSNVLTAAPAAHTQLSAPVHDHEHVARAPLSTIRLYVRPLTHSGAALRTSVTGDVRSARKETTERCASERDYGTTMIHTGGSESRGSHASTAPCPTQAGTGGAPRPAPAPMPLPSVLAPNPRNGAGGRPACRATARRPRMAQAALTSPAFLCHRTQPSRQ